MKTQALADFVVEWIIDNQEVGGQEDMTPKKERIWKVKGETSTWNIMCSILMECQKQNEVKLV